MVALCFFSYIFFRGFCVYCVPLPSLRGQHMVLCHPRWLPISGLTEFAMCWGGAEFERGGLDSMGRSWIRGSLYVYSCKLLPLLALCSESTAPFLVPLPNPHCPLNLYSSFLPTHIITMNTCDINMPECSSVEHNTAISLYQYWWISSVASWK